MDLSSINMFDILILGIVLISTFFALINGFIKSFVSLSGWIIAAVCSVYALPLTKPIFAGFIKNEMALQGAAIFSAYIVILIIMAIINRMILKAVDDYRGNSIDYSLGFAFGFLRGAFIAVIIYITLASVFPMLTPKKAADAEGSSVAQSVYPDWFAKAATFDLLRSGSNYFKSSIPDDLMSKILSNAIPKQDSEQTRILKKMLNVMPYSDLYNKDLQKLKANSGATAMEKKLVVDRLIEEYSNAVKAGLIKPEEQLTDDEIQMLHN